MPLPTYSSRPDDPTPRVEGIKRDPSKPAPTARELYQAAMDGTDADAMTSVGTCMVLGVRGFPQDTERGLELLRGALAKGNEGAAINLANLYLRGQGVPQDTQAGIRLLEASAERGSPLAIFNLGETYRLGAPGLPVDIAKAVTYFERAAKMDHPTSLAKLGALYLGGDELPENFDKAHHYLLQAAALEDIDSITNLGLMHALGLGRPVDNTRAAEYFQRAAEQGSPEAAVKLGLMFLDGKLGLEPDYKRAAFWFEQSAKRGDTVAMENLAWLSIDGKLTGGQRDNNTAYFWFDAMIQAGNPRGFLGIGNLFLSPGSGKPDLRRASEAFTAAHAYGEVDSFDGLGHCLLASNQAAKAIGWFEEGVKLGSRLCMVSLADCYEQGQGVTIDLDKARQLRGQAKP